MDVWTRTCLAIAVLSVAPSVGAAEAPDPVPRPREVAAGVWTIPEVPVPDREPDGNTVVFAVQDGLVVVDTGRHAWHRDAILALARQQHRRVLAVVNTHWHLDHVSGNPALRAAFPRLKVYASGAIDHALDGFLAASARESARYIDDPAIPAATRDDIRSDLQAIQRGTVLKPDIVIDASRVLALGHHEFRINLAPFAATSGDVWLYDEASGVAALGDLVTLPVPYLDTACPDGWRAALSAVAATPFRIAVPGHGPPLTQATFTIYRHSFERFLDCAASARSKEDCASQWADDVASLLAGGPARDPAQTASGAAYYVDLLRRGAGRSRYCEAN